MAALAPVPAPRSPFDGWRGWAVGIVVIGILVAVAKPWGGGPEGRPAPSAVAVSSADADGPMALPPPAAPAGQPFDLAALGDLAPGPAWTLVTSHARTPLEHLERPTGGPDPRPSVESVGEGIVAGPVIDLGTTDDLGALAIAHPSEVSLAAIRLWRFATDGDGPSRVELDPVPSPWPVGHVAVLAHRDAATGPDRVLAWEAGLYRLDLLIEPVGAVRSVMLSVRPGRTASGSPPDETVTDATTPFQRSTLRMLPAAANLWALGGYLSGWHRETARSGCAVADIWQATDPSDGCWPVPLGRTHAVGVNLATAAVTSIDLRLVDPLPGPAGSLSQIAVDGRAGLAFVRAPDGGLDDGIYRLDVGTSAGERLTWYLEVGPFGRAVASYYEASISR
jgi:hypothetical protein